MRSTERYQGRNQKPVPLSKAQKQERLSILLAKAAKQGGLLDPWEGGEARSLSAELGVDLGIERVELNPHATEHKEHVAFAANTQLEPAYSESGKVIGSYVERGDGHKWLVKNVSGKRHFLRRPPAIAYDKWTINDAQKKGVALLEVQDSDTGKKYICHITQFIAGCFTIDRGFGVQLALPMGKWNKAEEKQHGEQPTLLSE